MSAAVSIPMFAARFTDRSPRFLAPRRAAARPLLRAVAPPAAPVTDQDDLLADAVPWLTIYADEDEPGSTDEMLMEAPLHQQVPMPHGGASL